MTDKRKKILAVLATMKKTTKVKTKTITKMIQKIEVTKKRGEQTTNMSTKNITSTTERIIWKTKTISRTKMTTALSRSKGGGVKQQNI